MAESEKLPEFEPEDSIPEHQINYPNFYDNDLTPFFRSVQPTVQNLTP